MYQMKEQDKTPEKQLNEAERGNLPEKEFRIMIVKMIQDLGKTMEAMIIFSILFSRFWIIFTIITQNSFSGTLPITSSFDWSGGFLPCSFICCVFLCVLILLNLLFLGSPLCKWQVRSSCCFWCLLPLVRLVQCVV